MSNFWIAALVALSVGAWTYNKVSGRTGGNTQRALGSAGMLALLAFIIIIIILGIIM